MKKFLFVFALIAFFCLEIQIYSNYVSSYDECLIAGRGCYARSYLQQLIKLSDNNRSGCYARSYLQQLMKLSDNNRSGCYARSDLQQLMKLSDNNRSGCCSRHGGVCGCSGGRTKCCDGTLSPTCQCFMDENKGLQL